MRFTILQHSNDTPPGSVLDWLNEKKYDHDLRRLHKGDKLPTPAESDFIVILGGPMNVDDHDEYPWLFEEKAFLKAAISEGKTCLGLCLGGQLLAQTLGAKVQKHTHWEVGWHPLTVEGRAEELKVFGWHQDTFGLPPGAKRIATNKITENQGFAFGERVVGFQFHPEATREWVQELSEEIPYPSGPFVQDPKTLIEGMSHLPAMRQWFFEILNGLETKTLAKLRERR